MIPDKIHLEIVSPSRMVLSREVDEVVLPGQDGSFGVLPGHAPLLAGLAPGVAMCRSGAGKEYMAIGSGFAEVLPDRVIVLAETCEKASEIDSERAQGKISHYEQMLGQANPDSNPEDVRERLAKHLARLSAKSAK